jgi:hypothetical protein
VELLHAGAAVLQRRVLLDVEEVRADQVPVALLLAGGDAAGLDGRRHRGLQRVLADHDRRGGPGELAADLADHEVAGDEPDAAVVLVKDVPAGDRDLGALVVARGQRGLRHLRSLPVQTY